MELLQRNILILGKTGVGKTSLLNYLYNLHLPAGAGLPVTERGLHEHCLTQADICYHLYDSWGLEADSADKWLEEVFRQIRTRNNSPYIDQWFHTVLYCLNGNSARVENVELEYVLKPLLQTGCPVLIILTHASGAFNKQAKLAGMKKLLLDYIKPSFPDFSEERIIPVSSVEGKTLAGDKLERFGKETILQAAATNLAEDIVRRIPSICKDNIRQKLAAWQERSQIVIQDFHSGVFLDTKAVDRLVAALNQDLQNTCAAVDADAGRLQREIPAYSDLQFKVTYTRVILKVHKHLLGGLLQRDNMVKKVVSNGVSTAYDTIIKSIRISVGGHP